MINKSPFDKWKKHSGQIDFNGFLFNFDGLFTIKSNIWVIHCTFSPILNYFVAILHVFLSIHFFWGFLIKILTFWAHLVSFARFKVRSRLILYNLATFSLILNKLSASFEHILNNLREILEQFPIKNTFWI